MSEWESTQCKKVPLSLIPEEFYASSLQERKSLTLRKSLMSHSRKIKIRDSKL